MAYKNEEIEAKSSELMNQIVRGLLKKKIFVDVGRDALDRFSLSFKGKEIMGLEEEAINRGMLIVRINSQYKVDTRGAKPLLYLSTEESGNGQPLVEKIIKILEDRILVLKQNEAKRSSIKSKCSSVGGELRELRKEFPLFGSQVDESSTVNKNGKDLVFFIKLSPKLMREFLGFLPKSGRGVSAELMDIVIAAGVYRK